MIKFVKFLYKSIKDEADRFGSWYLKFLIRCQCGNVTIGKNFVSHGLFKIRAQRSSVIKFGDYVRFRNRASDNFVGLNKQSTIRVLTNAVLEIGDHTGLSNVSIFCSQSIKIGKYCNVGGNCFIWDTDFHELDYLERRKNLDCSLMNNKPVSIGDDVFIGANTIILKGINIGDRAVIGAGSVVSRSVPRDEIWAGNPIRFVRKLDSTPGNGFSSAVNSAKIRPGILESKR